jgi:hypothetical protein
MELIILLVLVLVVIGAVVFVASGRKSAPGLATSEVQGAPEAVMNELQLGLAGMRHTTVHRGTAESMTLIRDQAAAWAIVVAIFFFPIGLLALVARERSTGTVIAEAGADGTTLLRIAGVFEPKAAKRLQGLIALRALPQATARLDDQLND